MIEEIKIGQKNVHFARHNGKVVYPNYAAKENLVLHYDFSGRTNLDAKKGIAEDLSVNGNDEELGNFAYTEESGYTVKGLTFDGIDDHINFEAPLTGREFDESGISYCITFKANSVDGRGGLIGQAMDYNFGTYSNGGFYINMGKLILNYNSGASDTYNKAYVLSSEIQQNKKYSVVGTLYDGELKMYINGVLIDSLIGSRVIRFQGYPKANDIGRMMRGSYLNGLIYNAMIYKKALTPEEIQHNYQIDKQRFNIID